MKRCLSRFDLFSLFSIFFVCVLSIGQIVNYFFFYDDFFLFYALQFPKDKDSIFQSPDASAYRFLEPFFKPLFAVFSYNPMGYYVVSFLLFLVFLTVFYLFLKLLVSESKPPEKKRSKLKHFPLFSSLILASGYVGVEAFTWNMGAGPNNTIFLTLSFLSLLSTLLFLREAKIKFLLGISLAFLFSVYFFQFRAFLIFLWLPLLIVASFLRDRKLPGQFLFQIFVLLLFGLFLYKESLGFSSEQGNKIELDFLRFAQIFIRNTGNLFFPSELLSLINQKTDVSQEIVELLSGLFALTFLFLISLWFFIRRRQEFPLIFFFSVGTVVSLLLLHLAIGLSVNAPDVWYSSHRFYIVILPFLAGVLGLFLNALHQRFKNTAIFLLIVLAAGHVVLSNVAISNRWETPISHLQYFYKMLRHHVPILDKNSVLLIESGEPRPVSVFVSARAANAYAQIAGFYGLRTEELNLTTSSGEALKMLQKRGLKEDSLHVLFYKRGELINITEEARRLLSFGREEALGFRFGNSIEFKDLSLPAYAPLYIQLKLRAAPDFSNLGQLRRVDQQDIKKPQQYLPTLLHQEQLKRETKAESTENPLSFEHEAKNVVDGEYKTTWIPEKWGNTGVSVVVDLGEQRRIDNIVWSSSRTASWFQRLPSQYKIETSKSGERFTEVVSVSDAPVLKTGDFFVDKFPQVTARFIKIIILKTRGGLPPAIDEVESFDNPNDNLREYFVFKQNPERYLEDFLTAREYLTEILGNNILIEFAWRVDGNGEYPEGQSVTTFVDPTKLNNLKVFLPISGLELKSIKIKPANFPAKIFVEEFKIVYPTLFEFSRTE